jgi:ankyrin repeat protein
MLKRITQIAAVLVMIGSLMASANAQETGIESEQDSLIAAVQSRNETQAADAIARARTVNFVWHETTPLIEAIALETQTTTMRLLKAGADPNLAEGTGVTPLMAACWYGQYEIAKTLVERRAIVNIADKNGYTPLIGAASSNTEAGAKCVQLMLQHNARVNVHTDDGETALTVAAFYASEQGVKDLVASGANTHWKNAEGETAKQIACGRDVGRIATHDRICSFLKSIQD